MPSDRPKAGSVEERAAPDLLSADGRRIRGRIPYGVESRDLGGFREVIEPTAFHSTDFGDLVATVDHAGVPIGRHPTTLELEDRSDGLHWSVDPPAARADIREAIERGDLRAGSWRMRVGRDSWDGDVRHVHEIAELRDVSVVTTGAYPAAAAAVELRSAPNTNPGEAQEDNMGDQPESKQDQQQDRQEPVEQRDAGGGVPISSTGNLRVESRNERPIVQGLADLFEQRGFPASSATVSWDEYRALTWAGGAGGTALDFLAPLRREGVALGFDRRFLYPVMPSQSVGNDVTSVQLLRQATRTIPAGTAIVRALDATTTKPEVATGTELVSTVLSQVAAVESNVPNIYGNQTSFQSLIETDLRLTIATGYDQLVITGLNTSGTISGGTADIITKVRKAMTTLYSNGYNPDTIAIDAAGAEALDLTKSSGPEAFYVFGPGRFSPGDLFGVNVRVTKQPGTAVLDSQAFGRLYSSPLTLQRFEAGFGLTNQFNVRLESNATFGVERTAAAVRIMP